MEAIEILTAGVRMARACAPERRLTYGVQVIETVLSHVRAPLARVVVRASSDGSRRALCWLPHHDGRSTAWRLCAVDEWTRVVGRERVRCSHATPACALPATELSECMRAACEILRAALVVEGGDT